MSGSDTKIIVLEDDKTLTAALSAFCAKSNIEALVTARPEEAREFLSRNRVTTLFVDCLLPSENGVDFVRAIRKQYPKELLDVVLMSGVFQDPTFIKESLRDSEAVAFLKKPFTNEEFLGTIKRPELVMEKPHPRKQLYRLFNRPNASSREKRKAIEALEEIHGFDLPLIYSVLVDAKLSGHLNIVASSGDVSGIAFSEGLIVGVDIADKETYLGKLLIESGFLLPEDLNEALADKSPKRIGERLIQGNLLSPHGFNIVLSNQMSIRLSRTIVDQQVRVNFVNTEVEMSSPNIDSELFQTFLHDWIASKITSDWFKIHFTQWLHARFVKSPQFDQRESALKMPLVASMEGLINRVTSGSTLQEILDSKAFPEETLYKSLHFLLTIGALAFEERSNLRPEDRIKLMKKLVQQFANKNRMEVYNIMARMTNVSETLPEQVHKDFLSLLGSEPPPGAGELSTLYHQLLQIAKNAYDFSKSGNHERMKEEMAKGEAEIKLKAVALFDEAKKSLQMAKFREAWTTIQKVASMDSKVDRLHLYSAWARLGILDQAQNRTQALKEVELELMQVAPEDKFDALYHFVVGLNMKAKGDLSSARKSIEKAVAMDNTLIFARRELTVLSNKGPAPKQDIFDQDLKTLVGSLFGRKK